MSALITITSLSAHAHGSTVGDLTITHPYALPTPPGARTGGGYLKDLSNGGSTADTLVGASSPVADAVQVHEMRMDGDVMRMRAVPSIVIAPGQHVAMAPGGGFHLMFIGIRKPWVVGDAIPVTLQFARAGRVDVVLQVQQRNAGSTAHQRGMLDQ